MRFCKGQFAQELNMSDMATAYFFPAHRSIVLIGCFLFACFLTTSVYASSYIKPRIIVTTDITNEPDDQQSLIRLLVYANNYDIEGLIGSTGIWKLSDPATNVIHECINAYGQVWGNLVRHDKDFD